MPRLMVCEWLIGHFGHWRNVSSIMDSMLLDEMWPYGSCCFTIKQSLKLQQVWCQMVMAVKEVLPCSCSPHKGMCWLSGTIKVCYVRNSCIVYGLGWAGIMSGVLIPSDLLQVVKQEKEEPCSPVLNHPTPLLTTTSKAPQRQHQRLE